MSPSHSINCSLNSVNHPSYMITKAPSYSIFPIYRFHNTYVRCNHTQRKHTSQHNYPTTWQSSWITYIRCASYDAKTHLVIIIVRYPGLYTVYIDTTDSLGFGENKRYNNYHDSWKCVYSFSMDETKWMNWMFGIIHMLVTWYNL